MERGPRFCNDVFFDVLHFLRRKEHAPIRLACRRLQWLSDKACARYPPRVVPWLEVNGVAFPAVNNVLAAGQRRIVANTMRVHPAPGHSYLAIFPATEPPQDIVSLSELVIRDFVGPKLLQFLRVSARLLGECWLVFSDFDNFVRHHSFDFIVRFFTFFPVKHIVMLHTLSSLAVPLFIDHPTMFSCTKLVVSCLDTFPLDAFQGWLHLDEGKPSEQQQEKRRYLSIQFGKEVQAGHSQDNSVVQQLGRIRSVDNFVQQLKQRFLNATACCPFTVQIELFGVDNVPELDPFVVDNEWTREQLVFHRHPPRFYCIDRGRRENAAGQEEGDGEARTGEGTTTMMVYIWQMVQGDKQMAETEAEK